MSGFKDGLFPPFSFLLFFMYKMSAKPENDADHVSMSEVPLTEQSGSGLGFFNCSLWWNYSRGLGVG